MSPTTPARIRWSRVFLIGLGVCFLLVVAVVARCIHAFHDRNPDYELALDITTSKSDLGSKPLRVGFGRVKINPDLSNPARPVYMAGFAQNRIATKIHDDLWAIACVIDDGKTRLGVVALDAIGFFHDDVIAVRKLLNPRWKLNYSIVCSTHNHCTPDLMGLWGPDYLHSGVDQQYRKQVIEAAAEALGKAVAALQPSLVAFHEIPTPPDGLVADTRKPYVFDPDIRLMHFTSPTNGATIGTLVTWGNHPETPWSKNTEITADFPGYLRDALEHGVSENGQQAASGLGGTHLYINGAIGGLMSTTPGVTVHDPFLKQDFQEPSHEKTRALGRQLFNRIMHKLQNTADAAPEKQVPISIRARTIELPLENNGFLLAPLIGLIDRGHVRWKMIRSEVAVVKIGDASVTCIPGEIYPEIVNGGIEKAPGGDYPVEPQEVPPIRELMPGKIKFIFGLANDEVGYIIPKSEWDTQPPYLYGSEKPVYGEINSVGPDTAMILHRAISDLCGHTEQSRRSSSSHTSGLH